MAPDRGLRGWNVSLALQAQIPLSTGAQLNHSSLITVKAALAPAPTQHPALELQSKLHLLSIEAVRRVNENQAVAIRDGRSSKKAILRHTDMSRGSAIPPYITSSTKSLLHPAHTRDRVPVVSTLREVERILQRSRAVIQEAPSGLKVKDIRSIQAVVAQPVQQSHLSAGREVLKGTLSNSNSAEQNKGSGQRLCKGPEKEGQGEKMAYLERAVCTFHTAAAADPPPHNTHSPSLSYFLSLVLPDMPPPFSPPAPAERLTRADEKGSSVKGEC
ncbi:hypothetical protein EYF80_004729 [Liparis tanakae]|uniref:Uncharacterized protein n=1 Tax=Liparis tanakae TaxID=230148 RepID=A0A4Z2J404_9TELE|nr:hypothetical protein EYF80_004729 [Liparis tanakae]